MALLKTIHQFDVTTFRWFTHFNHASVIFFARMTSKAADGHFYVLLGLVALIKQEAELATLMAWGFAIERTIYFASKNLFKRNRPPQSIPGFISIVQPSDQFSFPSGHTSGAFLMTSILFVCEPMIAWFFLPWAASVALARVILGVHFPTDTVAGALIGISVCVTLNHCLF